MPPIVPNLIELPFTVPFTFVVPAVESLIVPLRVDPDCVQLRTNVPLKVPL